MLFANPVIANMGTINAGKKLTIDPPTYPGVSHDFADTYRRQKAMAVDVWVSAHGGQYSLHDKYKPRQTYSPDTFLDPQGFLDAIWRNATLSTSQRNNDRDQASSSSHHETQRPPLRMPGM